MSRSAITCACGHRFVPTFDANRVQTLGVDRFLLVDCPACGSTRMVVTKDAPSTCADCGEPIHGVKVVATGCGAMHDHCAEQVLEVGYGGAYMKRPVDRRPRNRAA